MKSMLQVLAVVMIGVMLFSGCSSPKTASLGKSKMAPAGLMMDREALAAPEPQNTSSDVVSERMITWTASLSIEVPEVSNAVTRICAVVTQQGGYVDSQSSQGDKSAQLRLRVPAKTFKASVANFETLGKITSRDVSADDVTEQYVDVEARLKNKIVLRDHLKQLLDKAVNVKDILAIEAELNRVQSDIDSMESRIKSLKGRVEYANIYITLERKSVPGPLGYLFKGVGWFIEKLFVLQD